MNSQAKKILVVDDDEGILEILVERLETMACFKLKPQIDCAASGNKALAMVESNTYDLLITDYSMPDGNGLELIEGIRTQTGDHCSLPIILLSGMLPSTDHLPEVVMQGVHIYSKPFDYKKLSSTVESLLS